MLNLYCRKKTICIAFSQCVSGALVIKHAKRLSRTVLSFEACLALPHFSTLSHKEYDCRKKVTEYNICVFFLELLAEIFSHSEKNSTRYSNKYTHVIMQNIRYSCQILMELGFSRQVFENTQTKFYENPSRRNRVVPCGRTDRQMNMTKLIVAFRNFCERA